MDGEGLLIMSPDALKNDKIATTLTSAIGQSSSNTGARGATPSCLTTKRRISNAFLKIHGSPDNKMSPWYMDFDNVSDEIFYLKNVLFVVE